MKKARIRSRASHHEIQRLNMNGFHNKRRRLGWCICWGLLLLSLGACEESKQPALDLTPPEPLSLSFEDTGASASDAITNVGVVQIAGLEATATWQYTTDNGTTWTPADNTTFAFTLAEGHYPEGAVRVFQSDVAGNDSSLTVLPTLTVDQTVQAPTMTLDNDTGVSASDNLTRSGLVSISGLESGASWEYSLDSGWSWTPGYGNTLNLVPRVYRAETFQVRQTDLAGNLSDPTWLGRFEIDNESQRLTYLLFRDTGAADNDSYTQEGTLLIQELEPGASWDYSLDSGSTWSPGVGDNFTVGEGTYPAETIQVRQTDPAGNPSTPYSNSVRLVVDQTAPAAPTLDLVTDSGISAADGLTHTSTLQVSGLESEATWEYSEDNGTTWAAGSGDRWTPSGTGAWEAGVLQVRQTDQAGNRSAPGVSLQAYELDQEAPTVIQVVAADNQTLDNLTTETISGFSVTFSEAIDPQTVTVNTDTACSGSLQVSADFFSTCFPMAASPVTTDNRTYAVSFDGNLLPNTLYTLRVTQAVEDEAGNFLQPYQQTAGFQRPLAVLYSYLKAENAGAEDQFGQVLDMTADYLAVGVPLEDSEATGTATSASLLDNATGSGAVYLFTNNTAASTFLFERYLKADNTGAGDGFGSAVALTVPFSTRSVLLAVGAPGEDSNQALISSAGITDDNASNSGAVYLFKGSSFSSDAYLKADNADIDDAFGTAVAADDNGTVWTVAVGAPGEDSSQITVTSAGATDSGATDSGAVYVYRDNGSGWVQYAYVKANNSGGNDHFGTSVAYENGVLAVGAPLEDGPKLNGPTVNGSNLDSIPNAGAVYVYKDNGTTFVPYAYLKADQPSDGDEFGQVVQLDNGVLYVGAAKEDSNQSGVFPSGFADNTKANSGGVYVFRDNGSTYQMEAFVKAGAPGVGDLFGTAFAADNGTLLVGSPEEDSAQTAVTATVASDDDRTNSGAAYLYQPEAPGAWRAVGYFKASQAGAEDALGQAVHLSGNFLAVAAPQEDSGQQSITATASALDNVSNAGAIYVFKFLE